MEQGSQQPMDRMERMERVLERLIDVTRGQQQQPQHLPTPVAMGVPLPPQQLLSIKDFQKMKPPMFEGEIDPSKADDWELGMEKIFMVVDPAQCPEMHKVVLATYNLSGEAYRWWLQQRDRIPNMTWAQFLEEFRRKYYPQTVRDRKATEFNELRQGTGSVAEYDKKFTELSRFAPHMVGTEALRARKFEDGLNDDLRLPVKRHRLATYTGVLNLALMSEE